MKKITYAYIKNNFEKEGYTLISDTYLAAKEHLKYVCPLKHKHSISWTAWQQGKRCPYCAGQGKPTIEKIKKEFEQEGYTLLSKDYKNNKQKLDYTCSEGHKHSITWTKWLSGRRCPHCAKNIKPEYGFVKHAFEKEGYTLISTEYKNAKSKLKYVCSVGHNGVITWDSWQQGGRCWACRNLNITAEKHYLWRGGVTKLGLPLYNTYAHQLNFAEKVRPYIDEEGRKLIEVRCTKCGQWFIPSGASIKSRILSLNGKGCGECRLYCSQECKDNCEVYRKQSKAYINLDKELPYTPEELSVWSQEVLTSANYKCEICEEPAEHAHHIEPKKLEPGLALDPENGLALCKKCHYKYGHADECSTGRLATVICK